MRSAISEAASAPPSRLRVMSETGFKGSFVVGALIFVLRISPAVCWTFEPVELLSEKFPSWTGQRKALLRRDAQREIGLGEVERTGWEPVLASGSYSISPHAADGYFFNRL